MNSALAGWLQVALLVVALAACYVPLGNYMAHIFTTDKDWKVERGIYKVIGIDSEGRSEVERLPAQHARVLRGERAVPVRPPAAAALPAGVRRAAHGQRAAGPGLQHGRLVRDQHELAELLRRVHHDLPGPDGRPRGAELHVRRGRHRHRHRAGPRVHAVQDRQAGQLLGGRDQDHGPVPASAVDPRRNHPDGRRRNRQLHQLPHGDHPVRRAPDHRRRTGRLAGGHQGLREQRRRFLQRQLRAPASRTRTRSRTGSRSSSCWSPRSR